MPNDADFRSNREIAIHVPDLERAEAFYVGVLGCRLISRSPDQLDLDTGQLRLYVNRDPSTTLSYIPSFDVADYAAARARLEAAGCEAVPVEGHPGLVYFRDPYGFTFDIIERA
jgi:catechol 2,3-dioxygenase-like lactoylglutathione lyase family enzyme